MCALSRAPHVSSRPKVLRWRVWTGRFKGADKGIVTLESRWLSDRKAWTRNVCFFCFFFRDIRLDSAAVTRALIIECRVSICVSMCVCLCVCVSMYFILIYLFFKGLEVMLIITLLGYSNTSGSIQIYIYIQYICMCTCMWLYFLLYFSAHFKTHFYNITA